MRTLFRSFSELCRVGDGASLRLKTSRMGEMVDATLPLASRAAKRLHWTTLIVALLNTVGDGLMVVDVAIQIFVVGVGHCKVLCWLSYLAEAAAAHFHCFCFHL